MSFNQNLIISDFSVDKLIFDINELFMGTQAAKEFIVYAFLSVMVFFALIAAVMSIVKLVEYIKSQPKREPVKKEVTAKAVESDVEFDIGEFGKVTSDSQITIKGEQLDYFILKNNKYEQDSLPIGTVVVLLKRSKREAYVKAATQKDLQKLEARGIRL